MGYQHKMADGSALALPVGKVVCIGRNYAEHARELNNEVPSEPLLFMKPATALSPMEEPVRVPRGLGSVHFETELAVLIGERLSHVDEQAAQHAIAGIGLGLDLTLRDVQDKLKAKGHPWERSKAFDGACPLSAFLTPASVGDLTDVQLRLSVNDEVRQEGNSAQMLTPILKLISYISQWFTLEPGDVVLTGTPAGVGALEPGDKLRVEIVDLLRVDTCAE
ncbi:fumarylacetoacetate hydrolase family protein [Marinobacterium sp. D7]|uniref:fumarylacetoacetate hydrolase family protein n=1 Tax=Marinobacterium ramblicola TaxID=2849041 RepID=UPI001C2DB367|nr:fumarylacetoacetate hydrolase family protein [Marinobacterium ramblicola]MBV1787375.1 fumarylacetoacetate hydrolase family protein [Marinobacterium ramblicola]